MNRQGKRHEARGKSEHLVDSFVGRVGDQIARCGLLDGGGRWLVAVSGGADSLALLHGLVMGQKAGWEIAELQVAHLNHQLRGAESDEDAEFVRHEAVRLGLKVTLGSAEVGKLARETGRSIEETARDERYRFLLGTAQEIGCDAVATGHTADDNVETILHRIVRGTGVRGLAGIPAVRELGKDDEGKSIRLVRPLLGCTRREVEAFLGRGGLKYRQDSSNSSREYTRNRIRHDLLPLLRGHYNPNVDEALANLGRTAAWCQETLREVAAGALADLICEEAGGKLVLDAEKARGLSRGVQGEVLHQVLERMGVGQGRIGFTQVGAVLDLLEKSAGVIQLPGGLTVRRDGGSLVLVTDEMASDDVAAPSGEEIEVPVPGVVELPGGYVVGEAPARWVEVECLEAGIEYLEGFAAGKTAWEEVIDADAVAGGLKVRRWRVGDRFAGLGASGSKTVGDFLTDSKVPQGRRNRVGMLCDDEGIVWVMGVRIAERVRVTSATKRVLLVRVE